jgi:tetratricopeptide (TPR) repeat protein
MYLQRGAPAFGDLERLLRSSEQQFPDQAAWDQLWARLYSAQGRNDAALERLASAYEKQKSPAMLLAYLNGQLDADRPDEVLELLGDWAELTQRSSQLQAIRARAVAMQGKVDEAIRLFRVALKTSGDNVNLVNDVIRQARQALPADQMLVLIESAVDDDPTGQIELLVCRYWVGQGRLSEAIERLRAMHAREPQRNDVLQMLAAACYAAGERDAAQQYYRTIVDRLPDNLTALNNLAFLLAEDETTAEQAIPLAERAVEVVGREAARADRANVLDTLGYVLYRAGRLEEAQNALRQSIDLAPMVPNHKHLGLVFIAKDQPESARRELMSARQIAEQNNDRAAIQEIDELLGSLEATAARAER